MTLVEKAGARVVAHQADVRDLSAVEAAVADGIAVHGLLDVVVAEPGISARVGWVKPSPTSPTTAHTPRVL